MGSFSKWNFEIQDESITNPFLRTENAQKVLAAIRKRYTRVPRSTLASRLAYRIKQEGIFFYNLRLIQLNIFAKKAFISPFVCCCCCFSLLSFFFGIMLFCVFICFIGIVTIIVCIFVQVFFFFWTAFSLFLLFLGLFCTLSFFFLLDCDSFSCSLFSFFFA